MTSNRPIRKVIDWTVEKLHSHRNSISFPEYQRQPHLWNDERKARLIDSILKDIDIPKLYFNQTGPGLYEVIDGQQRLWAIWDFLDDKFKVDNEGTSDYFSKLPKAAQTHITSYKLQVTTFDDAGDDYLRELFVRLQLGLLLNTGEKLHASAGQMKSLVFDKLARHDFFAGLGIPNRRYASETLCAQIAINSFSRTKTKSFARTRFEDLQHFFQEYSNPVGADLQLMKKKEKEIPAVLNGLASAFTARSRDLKNRSFILSIYLLYEELSGGDGSLVGKQFSEFCLQLWKRLKEESAKGLDRDNRKLYEFETLVSSAPGEKYQIQRRHEKLVEYYAYYNRTKKIIGD